MCDDARPIFPDARPTARYARRVDPARLQRVFRQHVRTDQLLGVDAVPRASGHPAAVPQPPARAAEPSPSSPARPTPAPSPPNDASARALPFESPVQLEVLGRDERFRTLEAMDANEVKGCAKCGLAESRHNTVFGEGDPEADVMFIGEGPGSDEDATGRPFVGRAGGMLNKWIGAMGLEREQVYIANVVKCRPPNNRAPMPDEVDACRDYLQRQIATVQPRVIVTLGGPAAKLITGTQTGITRLRGTWCQYTGVNPPIPVMPTFHPAFLLRSYTTDNRKKVWSDLQKAMEKLADPATPRGDAAS